MIGYTHFVQVDHDRLTTHYIMTQIIYVIDHNVVAKVAADDRAAVQPNREFYIVIFECIGFEFSDTYQSIKLALLYQRGVKRVSRYQHIIPVVRSIPVCLKFVDLSRCQVPPVAISFVLFFSLIVFGFTFWQIGGVNEIIAKSRNRCFIDLIHEYIVVWVSDNRSSMSDARCQS